MAAHVAGSPAPPPGRILLRRLENWLRIRLILAFSLLFLVIYGGCSWLALHMPYRISLATRWDDFAFQPAWAWVYLSMNPVLLLVAWRLPLARLLPWAWVLSIQTLWAAPFFLLMPVEPLARPDSDLVAFQLADRLNLSLNYFPSLHVCYAFTTAWFLRGGQGWLRGWLGLAWALAIACSTLAIREHYLVDILGGLLLAGVGVRFWQPGDLLALRAELYALWNLEHFVARHRRYGLIGLVLYASSLRAWRARRPLRLGFAYLQHVDDLLDGHRVCGYEPLELVCLRGPNGQVDVHVLSTLWQVWRRDLEAFPESLAWVESLRECMIRDRRRVQERALWSEEQLQEHFRETFRHSLNLLLCLAGHNLRAEAIPEMVDLLSWCSVFRDLDDDLAHGLINVPSSVVLAQGERKWDLRPWSAEQAARAQLLIEAVELRLKDLEGRPEVRLLRPFLRSARRIHAQVNRQTTFPRRPIEAEVSG